jgi:hypothetical protein
MNRRTKGVLLIGTLAVAAVVLLGGATVGVLAGAVIRSLDPNQSCETGFSKLSGCTSNWSSEMVHQSTPDPAFAARSTKPSKPGHPVGYVDVTSWAVANCPQNYIAKRLICGAGTVAAASDDAATGLPLPRPWLLRTAKKSPYIESVHVVTPLDLAGMLGFYRAELVKRGWTENDGAVIGPDGAAIAFTTSDGPAQLRLTHQDGRTIADLSRRKPAATNANIPPKPGKARLVLGNSTEEEAVITINAQTFRLASRIGHELRDDPETGRISPDSPELDLPPGTYKVTLKIAGGAAQKAEFEVVADETWGLLVGPDGVPLPVHLY